MSLGIKLMENVTARTVVARRVEARTHWIFLVEPSGIPALRAIEETYYNGERGADFEIFLRPDGNCVAMAAKRWMRHADLLAVLEKEFQISLPVEMRNAEEEDRDIMLLAQGADYDYQKSVFLGFHNWLMVQ